MIRSAISFWATYVQAMSTPNNSPVKDGASAATEAAAVPLLNTKKRPGTALMYALLYMPSLIEKYSCFMSASIACMCTASASHPR